MSYIKDQNPGRYDGSGLNAIAAYPRDTVVVRRSIPAPGGGRGHFYDVIPAKRATLNQRAQDLRPNLRTPNGAREIPHPENLIFDARLLRK